MVIRTGHPGAHGACIPVLVLAYLAIFAYMDSSRRLFLFLLIQEIKPLQGCVGEFFHRLVVLPSLSALNRVWRPYFYSPLKLQTQVYLAYCICEAEAVLF